MGSEFYPLLFLVVVCIIQDIWHAKQLDKVRAEHKRFVTEIYTEIVNMQSSNLETFIDQGVLRIPDDYVGTYRELIYDCTIASIPRASIYTQFVEDENEEIIYGANHKDKDIQ